MSILELILAGSLDCRLAALLWLLVGRRCPLLVVAAPSNAGKSTVLEALLAYLPAPEVIVTIRGAYENFAFLRSSEPARTCLLCPEISPGLPFYLWGRKVVTLFESLKLDYTLATTLHARSAEEAIEVLDEYLGVPAELLARLGFVVSLGVGWGRQGLERWVRAVDTVTLAGENKLSVIPVYRRETTATAGHHQLDDPDVAAALALKAGLPVPELVRAVERREVFLASLIERGIRNDVSFRRAISVFAGSSEG